MCYNDISLFLIIFVDGKEKICHYFVYLKRKKKAKIQQTIFGTQPLQKIGIFYHQKIKNRKYFGIIAHTFNPQIENRQPPCISIVFDFYFTYIQ